MWDFVLFDFFSQMVYSRQSSINNEMIQMYER